MVWRGLEGVAAGLTAGALTEDAFVAIGATDGGLRMGREDGGEGGRPTDEINVELGGNVEFWRGSTEH